MSYQFIDLLGNEIYVGDYVACTIDYSDLAVRKVLGFRFARLIVTYRENKSTSVHPSQCIKLRPEEVTMYKLKNENHHSC